jgi:hypothetical protein
MSSLNRLTNGDHDALTSLPVWTTDIQEAFHRMHMSSEHRMHMSSERTLDVRGVPMRLVRQDVFDELLAAVKAVITTIDTARHGSGRSSIERISLEAEDPSNATDVPVRDPSNATDDSVQSVLHQFCELTIGQQREVIEHITHGFTDDGSP